MFTKQLLLAVACSTALISCTSVTDNHSSETSDASLEKKQLDSNQLSPDEAQKEMAAIIAAENKQQAENLAATERLAAQEKVKAEAQVAAEKLAAQEKAEAEAQVASEKLAAQEKAKAEEQALAEQLAAQEKVRAEEQAAAEKIAAQEKAKAEEQAAAEKLLAQQNIDNEKRLAAEKLAAENKVKAEEIAKAQAETERINNERRQRLEAAKAAAAAERAAKAPQLTKTTTFKPLSSSQLTVLGAEKAGNSAGTIPAWTGDMLGLPSGLRYTGSGDIRPDPYAKEQPLFTIHAGNVDQYSQSLSEGQKMLFEKFPDSFFMHIYPSHRDGRFNAKTEERTAYNATHTKLINGQDGLRGYTGGVPFPQPKNGAEAIWNGRVNHPQTTVVGVMDDMAVYLNGNTQLRRQKLVSEYPFSYKDNPIGKIDEQISINAAYVHITVEQPRRKKDEMVIIHEALDQETHERKAWVYIPGTRRVRRAPTVGFDTPDGPGGIVTVDDSYGFNGALNRFSWKLVGKKEVYIPYHSYKFDDPKVNYKTLLQKGHANPDYMRYELHRVWVVEATLKPGKRHVYAKRRFYMDEDSWQIVLVDSYDGRGDLWRAGILNTVYDYAVQGYVNRAQMFHDFQSGAYIAMRLINETAPMNFLAKIQGEKYYTPSNLRKLGK